MGRERIVIVLGQKEGLEWMAKTAQLAGVELESLGPRRKRPKDLGENEKPRHSAFSNPSSIFLGTMSVLYTPPYVLQDTSGCPVDQWNPVESSGLWADPVDV
jgi:hypothetical protein